MAPAAPIHPFISQASRRVPPQPSKHAVNRVQQGVKQDNEDEQSESAQSPAAQRAQTLISQPAIRRKEQVSQAPSRVLGRTRSQSQQGQQQHRAGGMPSDLNDNDHVPMTFPRDDEEDDVSRQTGRGRQPELLAAMRAAAQPASNNFQTHTAIDFNHGQHESFHLQNACLQMNQQILAELQSLRHSQSQLQAENSHIREALQELAMAKADACQSSLLERVGRQRGLHPLLRHLMREDPYASTQQLKQAKEQWRINIRARPLWQSGPRLISLINMIERYINMIERLVNSATPVSRQSLCDGEAFRDRPGGVCDTRAVVARVMAYDAWLHPQAKNQLQQVALTLNDVAFICI